MNHLKRISVLLSFAPVIAILGLFSLTVSVASSAADNDSSAPLTNTAWRLVEIQSMDNQVFIPTVRDAFTLTFHADKRVSVLADCNQAEGTWTHTPPNGLEFGPLAATMAICPPESLHDRFMSDLNHTRSYILKDNRLFLATMADGAILEFELLIP